MMERFGHYLSSKPTLVVADKFPRIGGGTQRDDCPSLFVLPRGAAKLDRSAAVI
jgi:hypothetical protein